MSIFGKDLVTKPAPPQKKRLLQPELCYSLKEKNRTLLVVETGLIPHVEEMPRIPEKDSSL